MVIDTLTNHVDCTRDEEYFHIKYKIIYDSIIEIVIYILHIY